MERFQKVSASPTRPAVRPRSRRFDVADLYAGPAPVAQAVEGSPGAQPLDEKLRQAYFWVTNEAIINPFYDVEFNSGPPARFTMGDHGIDVTLPSDQSYSSYVLFPLLNLAVRRRCLLVGGPGRGKTTIAMLMGVLSGYPLREVKRGIQHGQPQMTVSDLLGNPLPSSLVSAREMDDVKVCWRRWLTMRVKIIDEYNRIPTRTQSALLTVMADNYAEVFDQVYECPKAAWYLTANDDAGGGTYQVIEALRDRIDVVVKALHFNTRFLGKLLARVEADVKPEELVPPGIIFTPEELDRLEREILDVEIGPELRRRVEFFASHFELSEPAARQFEYLTKDTLKLSGVDPSTVAGASGKDAVADLGTQTRNGLSVRALVTCLVFVKALAYFRGARVATAEDVRQTLPFVLHDKLVQESSSPWFEREGHAAYRTDRVSWIRNLFDLSCREYDRLDLDRDDPVGRMAAEMDKGLDGLGEKEARERVVAVERKVAELAKGRKLYGHLYDDVLTLKYLHQRTSNYLRWKTWKG
jgi:MoxR-like ATPase